MCLIRVDLGTHRENVVQYHDFVDAAARGDIAALTRMMNEGYDVNRVEPGRGGSALHAAAANGYSVLVEQLLAGGAHPNCPDRFGSTPLINAAHAGHLPVVQVLARKIRQTGGSVNQHHGALTPLNAAVLGGKLSVVRYLLSQGAKPSTLDNWRFSALDTANRARVRSIVEALSEGDQLK